MTYVDKTFQVRSGEYVTADMETIGGILVMKTGVIMTLPTPPTDGSFPVVLRGSSVREDAPAFLKELLEQHGYIVEGEE